MAARFGEHITMEQSGPILTVHRVEYADGYLAAQYRDDRDYMVATCGSYCIADIDDDVDRTLRTEPQMTVLPWRKAYSYVETAVTVPSRPSASECGN